MEGKEFNLLTEPWIKVLDSDLAVKEVSLTDALAHAHEYKGLAGEMPTQDIAVLRFLLACVQTIFYRYDVNGEYDELSDENNKNSNDVKNRWKEYWQKGEFLEKTVWDYFKNYQERFWLFHPITPFYQVADLEYGTEYDSVKCLYGNIKASNNENPSGNQKATKYHFSMCEGEAFKKMPYSTAARWLFHLNGFSVVIKKQKKAPGNPKGIGVGRLGQLGLMYVEGENLFEELMLNMTPLRPDQSELWGKPNPIWEQPVRREQSIEISSPDNLPELYTIQSRRILLFRNDGYVTGYKIMNGDYYPVEDDFNEPMTLWGKKENGDTFVPKVHNKEIQIWREFPSIFYTNGDKDEHIPGLVEWIEEICDEQMALKDTLVTYRTVGMRYKGQQKSSYEECISDGMTLSSELLRNFNEIWITLIKNEIEKCENVAEFIQNFAYKIEKILNQNNKPLADKLSEQYYAGIDSHFREWLRSIKPESDRKEDKIKEWREISSKCAKQVVQKYVATLRNVVLRYKKPEKEGESVLSIPKVYNEFLSNIHRIYEDLYIRD